VTDFNDGVPAVVSAIAPDAGPTVSARGTALEDIKAFLARPMLCTVQTWTTSTLNQLVYPVALWAATQSVQDKLYHYANLRGDFVLRFVVAGSPYSYGRCVVAWRPMHAYFPQDALGYAAHDWPLQKVVIDPSRSYSVEMRLPFFFPNETIGINGQMSATAFTDFGKLHFITQNALASASGVTPSDVIIQVYCWLENAELTNPTPIRYLASTTGRESIGSKVGGYIRRARAAVPVQSEAMKKGPISSVASTVASVADKLGSIPIIGEFAKATSMVAGVVGDVAAWFGFSRPNQVEDARYVRQVACAPLGQTVGRDNAAMLTLDPQNELSIDPRLVGLSGRDEMSFAAIAGTESFLGTYAWAGTDAYSTPLGMVAVTPNLATYLYTTGTDYVKPSCVGMVAALHRWWTGGLTFRFEVVATGFHRGRIQVRYSPVKLAAGTTMAGFGAPTADTCILDLEGGADKEITIGWARPNPYQHVGTTFLRLSSDPNDYPDQINGYLIVEVVNPLQTGQATCSAYVNVYVKASPTFAVAWPTTRNLETYTAFSVGREDATMPDACVLVGPDQPAVGLQALVMGEQSLSLRALCRRYEIVAVYLPAIGATGDTVNTYAISHPIMFPSGTYPPAASGFYGIASFKSWAGYMFVGARGGSRWKLQVSPGGVDTSYPSTTVVSCQQSSGVVPSAAYTGVTGDNTVALGIARDTGNGAAYFQNSQGLVEYQISDYMPTLFRRAVAALQNATYNVLVPAVKVYMIQQKNQTPPTIYCWAAGAEDFSLYNFAGPPVLTK
jgi:hypothetical protein